MINVIRRFVQTLSVRTRLLLGVAVLLGIAVALLLPFHHQRSAPSLTLYYRDGKTVLWKSPGGGTPSAFAAYVQSQLAAMYGGTFQTQGSWRVVTTLDPALQNAAREQMQTHQAALTGVQSMAFVAEDVTTGQIVSWANGPSASNADAVRAKTPVGTLMLPFDYAAYLQNNPTQTTSTMFADAQQPLPGYACTYKVLPTAQSSGQIPNCLWDRDFQYHGPMTLAQALASQRFVPAVLAAMQADTSGQFAGVSAMLTLARAMGNDARCYADSGQTYETNCYTAAVIGDGVFATPESMVQGYATLANAGARLPQSALLSVSLNGKTKYTWRQPAAKQTVRANVAQSLTTVLSDSTTSYLSADATSFTTQRGAKTAIVDGTTFQKDLASVVQFSSKYVAGFWATRAPDQQNAPLESAEVPIVATWFNAAQ